MDSFNKQAIDNKMLVKFHKSEIRELKREYAVVLSLYKTAVEDMKKAHVKFDRATKKLVANPSEKNEILLLGAERKLAQSILDTKKIAKELNDTLSRIEGCYDAMSSALLDSDVKAAAAYTVKKNAFVERAVMAIDEIEQIVSDTPVLSVESDSMTVDLAVNVDPKTRAKNEGNWAAHTLNQNLTKHKYDIDFNMPYYRNAVRDLERAAITLAKLNRKHKRSARKNRSATLEVAKDRYLEAVDIHNGFAMSINSSIDNVFYCYDELRKTLSPKGQRALAKVASEQDKYSDELQGKIDKLRAPIVKLGLKTVNPYPTK